MPVRLGDKRGKYNVKSPMDRFLSKVLIQRSLEKKCQIL
jgi:hypothetical protein